MTTAQVIDHFAQALSRLPCEGPVGLACSGGSDSMALLALTARHKPRAEIEVLSVDHGLRAEAQDELKLVKALCADYGLSHKVLNWTWDGHGNLQAAARRARYALMRAALPEHMPLLTGHTLEDQAETLLMRLARGSGVDGLCAMSDWQADLRIARPLLGLRRDDLRAFLRAENILWADDPSNENPRFARVKLRQAMPQLAELGLNATRLSQTARVMQEEAELLQHVTRDWCGAYVTHSFGDLLVNQTELARAPAALQGRVLCAALSWMTGYGYKQRRSALRQWTHEICEGQSRPLGGVLALPERGDIRLIREFVTLPKAVPAAQVWDERWQIEQSAKLPKGALLGALGPRGVAQLAQRPKGLPYKALIAQPAIWLDEILIEAPLLTENPKYSLYPLKPLL